MRKLGWFLAAALRSRKIDRIQLIWCLNGQAPWLCLVTLNQRNKRATGQTQFAQSSLFDKIGIPKGQPGELREQLARCHFGRRLATGGELGARAGLCSDRPGDWSVTASRPTRTGMLACATYPASWAVVGNGFSGKLPKHLPNNEGCIYGPSQQFGAEASLLVSHTYHTRTECAFSRELYRMTRHSTH